MKEKTFLLFLILLLNEFLLVLGCSPDDSSGIRAPVTTPAEAKTASELDGRLGHKFMELAESFGAGDGSPISKGEEIVEEIGGIADPMRRKNYLERFRRTILSIQFDDFDYIKLINGITSMERLHLQYVSALSRCGGSLEDDFMFRLDFLKWLRREMARPLMPEQRSERHGLFVSKERYQKYVQNRYELNVGWLEETFNDCVMRKLPEESADRVRRQIEDFLKRRIRTDEEIRRDRRERRQRSPIPCSQGEVDVSVSI